LPFHFHGVGIERIGHGINPAVNRLVADFCAGRVVEIKTGVILVVVSWPSVFETDDHLLRVGWAAVQAAHPTGKGAGVIVLALVVGVLARPRVAGQSGLGVGRLGSVAREGRTLPD